MCVGCVLREAAEACVCVVTVSVRGAVLTRRVGSGAGEGQAVKAKDWLKNYGMPSPTALTVLSLQTC